MVFFCTQKPQQEREQTEYTFSETGLKLSSNLSLVCVFCGGTLENLAPLRTLEAANILTCLVSNEQTPHRKSCHMTAKYVIFSVTWWKQLAKRPKAFNFTFLELLESISHLSLTQIVAKSVSRHGSFKKVMELGCTQEVAFYRCINQLRPSFFVSRVLLNASTACLFESQYSRNRWW